MKTLLFVLALFVLVAVGYSTVPNARSNSQESDDTEALLKKQSGLVIENYRDLDPNVIIIGPPPPKVPSCIVFSATGTNHASLEGNLLLFYQDTKTNLTGNNWTGATFTAPTSGTYFFTISLVAFASTGGPDDDVFVHITRNGQSLGFAWKGEQAPAVVNSGISRIGASYSVTTQLNQGDMIQTFVSSDGGLLRRLAKFDFTGFRICM